MGIKDEDFYFLKVLFSLISSVSRASVAPDEDHSIPVNEIKIDDIEIVGSSSYEHGKIIDVVQDRQKLLSLYSWLLQFFSGPNSMFSGCNQHIFFRYNIYSMLCISCWYCYFFRRVRNGSFVKRRNDLISRDNDNDNDNGEDVVETCGNGLFSRDDDNDDDTGEDAIETCGNGLFSRYDDNDNDSGEDAIVTNENDEIGSGISSGNDVFFTNENAENENNPSITVEHPLITTNVNEGSASDEITVVVGG